jgi:hypothetical protein
MSPLRHRMIEDMQIRNLTLNTQRVYAEQVGRFARHFRNHHSEDLGCRTEHGGESGTLFMIPTIV